MGKPTRLVAVIALVIASTMTAAPNTTASTRDRCTQMSIQISNLFAKRSEALRDEFDAARDVSSSQQALDDATATRNSTEDTVRHDLLDMLGKQGGTDEMNELLAKTKGDRKALDSANTVVDQATKALQHAEAQQAAAADKRASIDQQIEKLEEEYDRLCR